MNFLNSLSLLGQTEPSPFGGMVPILLLVVIFYFLMIRPQQRQRKAQAARIASLAPGDKVVSAGGIHGLVHNVKDTTVVVKVAEGTMLEFEKSSMTTVVKKDAAPDK